MIPKEKRCSACKEVKDADQFYVRSGGKYLNSTCKQCSIDSGKKHYHANKDRLNQQRAENWQNLTPEARKARSRSNHIRAHGITEDDYDRMLAEQDGRCAICQELPPEGEVLHIDHDHKCCAGKTSCGKCVRKLLCSACNRGIGCFKDNVALLKLAMEYLDAQHA